MIILLITIMIRIKPECVELVMEKTAVGDWFLLYLLGQNIDHIVFKVVREMMIGGKEPGSLKGLVKLWTICRVLVLPGLQIDSKADHDPHAN